MKDRILIVASVLLFAINGCALDPTPVPTEETRLDSFATATERKERLQRVVDSCNIDVSEWGEDLWGWYWMASDYAEQEKRARWFYQALAIVELRCQSASTPVAIEPLPTQARGTPEVPLRINGDMPELVTEEAWELLQLTFSIQRDNPETCAYLEMGISESREVYPGLSFVEVQEILVEELRPTIESGVDDDSDVQVLVEIYADSFLQYCGYDPVTGARP